MRDRSPGRPGAKSPTKPGTTHPGVKPGTTYEQRDRRERFERARRESLRPDDLTVAMALERVGGFGRPFDRSGMGKMAASDPSGTGADLQLQGR